VTGLIKHHIRLLLAIFTFAFVAITAVTSAITATRHFKAIPSPYFNTPTYNTTTWRNLVSCQEVGHTLGLDHQDENFNNEFLATLSHELRTPLTSILGWSHLLTGGKLDKQQTARAIETIARNARAQGRLIDELLDISRIRTGKLCLDLRAVKLAPLIQAVVDDVRPAADARSINLEAAFNSDIGPILGDPDRLQQIVWNLLTNAIKFTPTGGDVQVRLERNNSHALITVNDSGQGIATELLPYVFERFRQSDSSNTRSNGGLD
jgi:signal transduction histidine kinase